MTPKREETFYLLLKTVKPHAFFKPLSDGSNVVY